MPEVMNSDGTWTELTDEEYIARYGKEDLDFLRAPIVDPADMSEGERSLALKMQDQELTNLALADSPYESILDLPVEGDDEELALDDFEPRDYDFEGALEDLRARQAAAGDDSGA